MLRGSAGFLFRTRIRRFNMLYATLMTLALTHAEPAWLTDYDLATERAIKEKKDLIILFQEKSEFDDVFRDPELHKRLEDFVLLRVPTSFEYRGKKLLDYSPLEDMLGKPGFAIISYHNDKLPTHGEAISVHALIGSRYRWAPAYGVDQLKIILDLPAAATLSQRSMIYAVRVHPERPASIHGECHSAFLAHAQGHSRHQASTQRQHHANLIATSGSLQSQGASFSGASEVVAESWGRVVGGENVLEAAFSCIDAWRHSSSHWSAVAGRQRYFGYDIAR